MEQIEKYLKQLVQAPRNGQINFDLASAYEKEKQYAAALSYYLRCAEFTKNKVLASECLLRCSFSMDNQGGRDQKALHFIKQAITASPCSMEPYYTASLYFSWRGKWSDSYLYASLGLNIYENDIQTKKFGIDVGYSDYNLYYQKALSGIKIGKINEARQIYTKILSDFDIADNIREIINNEINKLPPLINKIPKKIFQTWETSENELSPDMQYYINSWKEKNPDYEFHFYNANERYKFIKDNFDHEVLDAYNRLKPGAFKCDLWRLCILYIHGGFYADIDTLCCNSLNIINTNVDFICAIDLNLVNKHELANGFIGSVSKHKILKLYIDKIIYNINNTDHKLRLLLNIICGTACFGHVVNEYLNLQNNSSFIGKEGIINNDIHFLKFEKKDEFMIDTITNVKILQNKNGNINIKTAYDKECKKIKSFFCFGKFGEMVYITDIVDFETILEISEDEPLNIIIKKSMDKEIQNMITLEIKEKSIKNLYDFIPCHDQGGNDLCRVNVDNIEQVLTKIYNDPKCVAINTQGYVKTHISNIKQINGWNYPNDGIYIKKSKNDKLKLLSKVSIPVLGTLVCTTTKWVIKQLKSIDYPVENYIILNNNKEFLEEELDKIVSLGHKFIKNLKVFHMPYNLGCAEGWNTIIKSFIFSPYWVISNDDVSFTPGFLKELHDTAQQNPDAGFIHGTPIGLNNLKKFGSFDLFLIRDWVIKDYGLFDINYYPAYFEDFDYMLRLRNKPIKIINQLKHRYYHGDTFDYNTSGKNTIKTSNELSNRLINAKYKNYEYFQKKWNCYAECITSENINDIYKYPFNNPENSMSFTTFDIDFVREKHLRDALPQPNGGKALISIKEKIPMISINRPNVIVIDDFYKNPDEIREYALSLTYQPPENHGAVGYRCESGRKIIDGTKEFFEKMLHCTISTGNGHGEWDYGTNGCFQWCNGKTPIVYHADSQKYAGIIYLTPNAPPNCGTSFFRHKKSKIRDNSVLNTDWYNSDLNYKEPHLDKTQWEPVDSVGNVYNRLVIFESQHIHAVTEYFGEDINNSRLFQLFFFNIN
jgi:GT2 family glycosyltransferase